MNKDDPIDVVAVGKWHVGYSHSPEGMTLLLFEFDNRPPINLAICANDAQEMANAILEIYRNPPTKKHRHN